MCRQILEVNILVRTKTLRQTDAKLTQKAACDNIGSVGVCVWLSGWVGEGGRGVVGRVVGWGGMRRKRHQTRLKIINRI